MASEDPFIISPNLGGQNLGRVRLGCSFAPHGICCNLAGVFAGSLSGLEGQGGPCLAPLQERLEGWAPWAALHASSGPLLVVTLVSEWHFLHVGSKSGHSKRQEVETARLLRPEHQNWYSIPSAIFYWSKKSQSLPRFKLGDPTLPPLDGEV